VSDEDILKLVKLVHTAIWALMATAIVAVPIAAMLGRFRVAGCLSVLIIAECLVLLLNGGRCPLTDLAARFTSDRSVNFDIFLQPWLAEHNKLIFGSLFVAGELVLVRLWFAR